MTVSNADTFFYCWHPPAFNCLGLDNFTWMAPIQVHGDRFLFADNGPGEGVGDLQSFTSFDGTNSTMQDPAGDALRWATFVMDDWDAWYALHVAAGGGEVPFTCLAQNLGVYHYTAGAYVDAPPNIMPLEYVVEGVPNQTTEQMELNFAYWDAWTEAAYTAIIARKGVIPPYAWLDTEGMRTPSGSHVWYIADPEDPAWTQARFDTYNQWSYRLCRGFCFGLGRACNNAPPLWGNYAKHQMQSTTQPSCYVYDQTDFVNDRLEGRGFQGTGKPMVPWVIGPMLDALGIDVYCEGGGVTTATVEVTGTTVVLVDDVTGTTTLTMADADKDTLSEMATAMNNVANWTAAMTTLTEEGHPDTASSVLETQVATSCVGSANEITLDGGTEITPFRNFAWSKDRIDIFRHDTLGLMDNPNDPIQTFIYWTGPENDVEEIWNLVDGWLDP